ncbi:hypothetical protein BHL25_19435 [Bacillus cereus]|nr:hypothetical protein BHL25_19435 [Bacillus cereus]
MTPQKRNIIISIIILIIIKGYTILTVQDKNATKEKAAKAAIQHIKKEENVDLVVTEVTIEKIARAGFITVRGHAQDNNQKTFYVVINKTQNYSVAHFGKTN